METTRQNFRCMVCDLDTPNLPTLHKHQSLSHTSEELSLSILTLQSFLYHKHYFQTFDSKPATDVCYFHPFCTQVFSDKKQDVEASARAFTLGGDHPFTVKTESCASPDTDESKTPDSKRCMKEKMTKKKGGLRLPRRTWRQTTPSKSILSTPNIAQISSATTDVALHGDFLNSANGLCDDLIKLRRYSNASANKIKRKRLNEKNRSRPIKRDNRQMVQKPLRKPLIPGTAEMTVPHSSVSENFETLEIGASNSEENTDVGMGSSGSSAPSEDNAQPLESDRFPMTMNDMSNCGYALTFNIETSCFEFKSVCLDKNEGDRGMAQGEKGVEDGSGNEVNGSGDQKRADTEGCQTSSPKEIEIPRLY